MDISTQYKHVRTGVTLIKVAITLIVFAVLVGIISLLLARQLGVAAMGMVGLAGMAIWFGFLLAFVGKVVCIGTPTARPIIAVSVVLDLIAGVSSQVQSGIVPALGSLLSMVSMGLFFYFLYQVGEATELPDICEGVTTTIKKGVTVFLFAVLTVGLGTVSPALSLLGSVPALVFGISAFFSYLRLLDTVRMDLERGEAQAPAAF